jgi:hypothetical protein
VLRGGSAAGNDRHAVGNARDGEEVNVGHPSRRNPRGQLLSCWGFGQTQNPPFCMCKPPFLYVHARAWRSSLSSHNCRHIHIQKKNLGFQAGGFSPRRCQLLVYPLFRLCVCVCVGGVRVCEWVLCV